jgi:hypothetical protein
MKTAPLGVENLKADNLIQKNKLLLWTFKIKLIVEEDKAHKGL